MRQVVDDFSSKLDLPRSLERVESIDANHTQMARCNNRADPRYRAIVGVLKQFMHVTELIGSGSKPQEMPSTALHETQRAASGTAAAGSKPDGATTS